MSDVKQGAYLEGCRCWTEYNEEKKAFEIISKNVGCKIEWHVNKK